MIDELLGPDGPEVSCEECFERLDEYVELELAGEDADGRVPGHARAPRAAARPAARTTRACATCSRRTRGKTRPRDDANPA